MERAGNVVVVVACKSRERFTLSDEYILFLEGGGGGRHIFGRGEEQQRQEEQLQRGNARFYMAIIIARRGSLHVCVYTL